uniref:NADH dehydrogenase subunit 6 n=1 Tax=Tonicia forbesii TaxID=1503220 RepID=A0A6H1PG06_9MOLL|nr:NADH dehydrogenase subunit 6 [Tonicia forbesii]
MVLSYLFSLILTIMFTLFGVKQPLSMGSLILLNSLVMSISIFFEGGSWFSFILFLIYIGGLLVMFAYVTALTPNLIFKKSNLGSIFFMMWGGWLVALMYSELVGVKYEVSSLNFLSMLSYHKLGASLFSFFSLDTIIGLVLILLFVLLCVVKICYTGQGPLRPFK